MPLDLDESWYLANSHLVSKGLIPYKDFFGRSPFLLYLMAASASVFTNDIFIGRLPSVLFSTGTVVLVYSLANRTAGRRTAVISGAVMALAPFSLRYGYLAVTEPVSVFFVLLSVYLYYISTERTLPYGETCWSTYLLYLISGGVLCCAVLTRRSSAIFALAMPILYMLASSKTKGQKTGRIKEFAVNNSLFYLGFGLPFLLGLILMFGWGDLQVAVDMYDLRELWRFARMEKTLIWNIRELGYQALYVLAPAVIFLLITMKKLLKDTLYRIFLGSTALMVIIYLSTMFPTGTMEGLISSDSEGLLTSMAFMGGLLFSLILIIQPEKGLDPSLGTLKDRLYYYLPFAPALAGVFLIPGFKPDNSTIQWFLYIYVITFMLLVLYSLDPRIERRFDSSTSKLYRICLLSVYAVYLLALTAARLPNRDIVLMLAGSLFISAVIGVKLILMSKGKRTRKVLYDLLTRKWFKPLMAVLSITSSLGLLILLLIKEDVLGTWESLLIAGGTVILPAGAGALSGTENCGKDGNEKKNPCRKGSACKNNDEEKTKYVLPLFLAGVPFIFYFARSWWMPIYFYEMMPGFSIMTGIAAAYLCCGCCNKEKGKKIGLRLSCKVKNRSTGSGAGPLFLLILLVLVIITPFVIMNDPYNIYLGDTQRHPEPKTIRDIGSYLRDNTSPGEEIFCWPVYAYQAQRQVLFNITHPLIYSEFSDEEDGSITSQGYPAVRGIMDRMENEKVRLVVLDANLEDVFFTGRDYFSDYIHTHYNTVHSIHGTRIMLRNIEPEE